MREIKFRAWDKNRTGAYLSLVYQNDQELWEYLRDLEDDKRRYECDFELMQFTGLKDKNGKMIFEGDVVKNQLGISWSIFYSDISSSFRMQKIGEEYTEYDTLAMHISDIFHFEIIGNIYENPELLTTNTPSV